jgi:hypothetical protein
LAGSISELIGVGVSAHALRGIVADLFLSGYPCVFVGSDIGTRIDSLYIFPFTYRLLYLYLSIESHYLLVRSSSSKARRL